MRFKIAIVSILSVVILSTLLTSCSQFSVTLPTPTYQKAEVLFEVVLPAKLPEGSKLQIEILDDVTGLAFNPQRFDMIQNDDRNYYFKTALTVHANVKYRYLSSGQTSLIETNSQGQQVRFRLLNVNNPIAVMDTIASWPGLPYQGAVGSITGQFYDQATHTPLPNLLVSAQGIQAITASDGSFSLNGITPGTHNLTAMALDGTYADFQQLAVVAENGVTPVFVGLEKRELVNIDFKVEIPQGITPISELRFASNLYSLGNLYADVFAGSTMLSADLPPMQKNSDGSYSIRLVLPAGAYFNYKYTLGDGFWNGELMEDGSFYAREFIVPQEETTQKDTISAFQPQQSGVILFNVTVPANTPVEDVITIQFNPFDWTAPIPMTRIDSQHWSFILYNPQGYFGQTKFRFCRNSICELTHEVDPLDAGNPRVFTPGAAPQTIQANVDGWQMLSATSTPTTVITEPQGATSRTDFLTGFEIESANTPLLRSTEATLFGSIAATGANWTIVQPTWSTISTNPPVFGPIPGENLLWTDTLNQILEARKAGLSVAVFPRVQYTEGVELYWQNAQKDPDWWQHWFDSYHRFIMQNTDAANLSGAAAIILGDPTVAASYGDGFLPGGSSSNSPSTANDQWRQLITDIRARYSGPVIAALDMSTFGTDLPDWFDSVDAVYLIIHPEISAEAAASFQSSYEELDAYLENTLKPVSAKAGKPVLIGLSVSSTSDAHLGCSAAGVDCSGDHSAVGSFNNVDMDLQARITNALILSASTKPYINGFFSRGYQAAGSLQDGSFSVHGKPANDVLWYWYHFLGGKSQ